MPEGLEVEFYRRLAESRALGRVIAAVEADDAWYLKRGLDRAAAVSVLTGASFSSARRVGKLLLLDVRDRDEVIGMRFGMTGRLLVDDTAAIDRLEYSSAREEPQWDRFVVRFEDGGDLRMRDPRRLGGVELDPDLSHLGPDALGVTLRQLREVLATPVAVKARLLDQQRVAGLGNLLVDEVLWQAGIDPARRSDSLDDGEVRRLHRTIRSTLPKLLRRGGSHTGDLMVARVKGAACPRDGTPLERRTIGGRTTFSCPVHQR